MFTEPNLPWLNRPLNPLRYLTGIGLGGISEGWLPDVLLYRQTRVCTFARIFLVDGRAFRGRNKARQHFRRRQNKAVERRKLWGALYPKVPMYSMTAYVDRDNIGTYVRDGSAVLVSPDNHPTRVLVSDYVAQLDNALLIVGGNDAITEDGGNSGVDGWVAAYCRVGGHNVTPPITQYHDDLRHSPERLPSDMGCEELAQAGAPQLLATNLLVGHMMSYVLYRYLTQPLRQAVDVVEVCVNSATGGICRYGIRERYLGTVFSVS